MTLKPSILDVLDRMLTGPKCTRMEWDIKIIPTKTAEKVKKYGIKFDPKVIVVTDRSLIKDVFHAGFELALDTGVLCTDTERIIKFTEEELTAPMREGAEKNIYGEGTNTVEVVQRKPEDGRRPRLTMGPFGQVFGEDIFIPAHEAAARVPNADILVPASLATVYGRELRSGTPMEVLGGYLEAVYTNEGIRRAGRQGMPKSGVESDVVGLAQLAAFTDGYYKPTDMSSVNVVSELKTSYYQINKVVQATNLGIANNLHAYGHPMIGGYAGGEEGAAVMAVAQELLCNVTLMGEVVEATVTDIRTMGNSTPSALRANSVAIQAIAHNTKLKYSCDNTGNLDTCTDPFLYEVANIQMVITASGVSESHGPRTGGGRYPEHSTPVEATLMGEVAERAAGMKREDANELAFKILEKYQGSLKYPPKGKSWREVIDPRTLKPIKEWTDLYNKVRKDLIDIGLFTE